MCRDQSSERVGCRCDDSIDDTLAFLDLNKVSKLPSELFSHIEVKVRIPRINKLLVQDLRQDPRVIRDRVAPNIHVIICTKIEIDSIVILSVKLCCIIDVCIVDCARFAISCLHYDLFAILFQKHIDYLSTVTIEVHC